MCGICGYIGTNQPDLLKEMCDAMIYRGPDDYGTWYDAKAKVGLGHRRLSIIDISKAGHQPMSNDSGTIQLSYNGELYNFLDHRNDLVSKGYIFRGNSDTEVILYLYEEYGLEFLNKLNGIFALAIWDTRRRELLLVRDHAGVKPLYFWQNGKNLFFASEIKALLRVPGIPRELNEEAVLHYLTFLWVPGDETMLKAVNKLEPGHYLIWKDGQIKIRQWFTLEYSPDVSISEPEWVERVHDTFMQTTRRQMISDVPLGAFLSGGLDSSSIVACMRQSFPEREINCYTMAYDDGGAGGGREGFEEDFPYAKRVAEIFNVNLKSRILKPDVVSLLPKMIYHMDEPDADATAISTYIVSKMAHDDGSTVLLSGTGGDEVFFGYRSHQAYRHYERLRYIPRGLLVPLISFLASIGNAVQGAQSPIARRLRKFNRGFAEHGLDRHLAIVDWSSPQTRNSILTSEFAGRLRGGDLIPKCMEKYYNGFCGQGAINQHSHILNQTFLAAHNFLYGDKCGMAASIEIRVPFMDIELMQLCANIPEQYKLKGNITKSVLKKAMERYLPKDILYRSKTGFGPPVRDWIVNDFDEIIREYLHPESIKLRGLFNPAAVQKIIDDNRNNQADHGYLIYSLLSLEVWMRTFIDNPGIEIST